MADDAAPVAAPAPTTANPADDDDATAAELPTFYLRYYVGHTGRHGHEFLEFEVRDTGLLKYANNSKYRGDNPLIKKEATVAPAVLAEMARIIKASQILECSDDKWPTPDRNGRQELEVLVDGMHISFTTNKVATMAEILASRDADGLGKFFYVTEDLKKLVFALIGVHHKVNPV